MSGLQGSVARAFLSFKQGGACDTYDCPCDCFLKDHDDNTPSEHCLRLRDEAQQMSREIIALIQGECAKELRARLRSSHSAYLMDVYALADDWEGKK